MSLIGHALGHIRVIGELARGGMGEVYVGFDETLQRRVALKAIRAEHRLDREAKTRFLREARLLSQLDHPNICRIHDYIERDEADFLVLELIEGETLAAAAARLDRTAKLGAAKQIAQVLATAHERGIVHRDLKPGNVMLTTTGEVKVLDFGIASTFSAARAVAGPGHGATPHAAPAPATFDGDAETFASAGAPSAAGTIVTRAGVISGTGAYMSPEQARGEPLSAASDMYSYGLLLQELFTGRSPHPAGLPFLQLIARAADAQSEPVTGVDAQLTALIGRLKQPAPAARPTAFDVVERLTWIQNRPKQRLRIAAAVALALVLALGALKYTLDVRTARNEAERRRGQAEDLIGFMLGDLREKLTAVGRLEVLDEAGAKALAYFDSLPASAQTDDEIVRRAKALSQIGEVRLAKGDSAGAATVLEQSLSLAAAVAGRDPSRTDWQLTLGVSHFWVGYAYWNKGDLDRAMSHFLEYKAVADRLVARQPDRREWQLELAQARSNLGAVLQARGENDQAIAHFQAATDLKARLLAASPDDPRALRELSVTQSWLAEALQREGRLAEALDRFLANGAIIQRLTAKDPANTDWRHLLAIGHGKIGAALRALGKRPDALEQFDAEVPIARSLVAHDPLNGDWRRELGSALLSRSGAHSALGHHAAALQDAREGHAVLKALADSDASSAEWRRQLANAENALASASLASGAYRDALDAAARARITLEPLAKTSPRDPGDARRRSDSYLIEGRAHTRSGRHDDAAIAWQRALDTIAPAAQGSANPDLLWPMAQALALLDRPTETRAVVQVLTSQGFRPDAVRELCRQHPCRP